MPDYIYDEVQRLKTEYNTNSPFELADALGINIALRPGLGTLKGFYAVLLRQKYIVINVDLPERDRLVVAAHELAHARLHGHITSSPLRDLAMPGLSAQTEYQANFFAADLLIEDDDVIQYAQPGTAYADICASLGFPPNLVAFKVQSMIRRGFQLQLPQELQSKFLQSGNAAR